MICKICKWVFDDDYIDQYRQNTCDYEFTTCPSCENEVEQED